MALVGGADYRKTETLRPEYVASKLATKIRSAVTGKPEWWDSPFMRSLRMGVASVRAAVLLLRYHGHGSVPVYMA